MIESIQERIVKKIASALTGITATDGYANTVRAVVRQNQSGIDLAGPMPVLLVQEGECTPELDGSTWPWTHRRLEIFAVAFVRQDASELTDDARSGGEILNSLMTDVEKALFRNPTWDGLAIMTDPPSYLEIDVDEGVPHLAKALRVEIVFRHVRNDPYLNVA